MPVHVRNLLGTIHSCGNSFLALSSSQRKLKKKEVRIPSGTSRASALTCGEMKVVQMDHPVPRDRKKTLAERGV